MKGPHVTIVMQPGHESPPQRWGRVKFMPVSLESEFLGALQEGDRLQLLVRSPGTS